MEETEHAPTSPWMEVEGRPRPSLAGDLDVDVAVVGGGITGLTAAYLLAGEGRRVCVLEARRLVAGVSGGTTAHLTEALDTRYHELIRTFGEEGAATAARSQRAAIDRVERIVRDEGIDAGLRRVPGWLYAESAQAAPEVEREAEAVARLGLDARLTTDVPLPFSTTVALRFERQAELHPRRYLLPLADRIEALGGSIFEHTRVTDFEDGTPCTVHAPGGTVTARAVLFCTHANVSAKLLLQPKLAQYRSYVIALRSRGPLLPGLFWDTADPYHYVRGLDDGQGPLVLVGGEDHKVGQEDDTRRPFARLEEWAIRRFDWSSIAYRWSAQVVEPVDGLPYVGRNPAGHHVYLATGYAGNGITSGTMAAMLLADLALGRESPWASLYDPGRKRTLAQPSHAAELVAENLDFPAHLLRDRLSPAEAHGLDEVARGEGKIVQLGGHKVACFRDEQGQVHALSPACTHLGCHVAWNAAERSWDCPCHGSRFAPTGEVIDGPAIEPLPKKKL